MSADQSRRESVIRLYHLSRCTSPWRLSLFVVVDTGEDMGMSIPCGLVVAVAVVVAVLKVTFPGATNSSFCPMESVL